MALAAYYPLDKDVLDYSGNNKNGTNNGVTFVTGKINNAGVFNGTTDYITLPSTLAKLSNLSAWSLSGWLKTPGAPSNVYYSCGHASNASDLLIIYIKPTAGDDELRIFSNGVTIVSYGAHADFPNDILTHVTLTYDGTDLRYYKGNVLQTTITVAISSTTATQIRLGNWSNQDYDGEMDDVRIYDHVLTEIERADIYNLSQDTPSLQIQGNVLTNDLYIGKYTDVDHVYQINIASLEISDDEDNSNVNLLLVTGNKRLEIIQNGEGKYTGIVEDWHPNENGYLNIYSVDYAIILHGDPITTYDCNNNTADVIIADLLDTYGLNLFNYNLDPTTTTYDDIFFYMTPLEIMQELVLRENHSLRLSPTLEWRFQPRANNDLGINYTEGEDFFTPSFPKIKHKIKNSFYAIDDAGQVFKKQDLGSIADNFTRTGFLDVPDATTEPQIRKYLNSRVTKDSGEIIPGDLSVPQDLNLQGTGLIRINYAQLGWVNQLTYIHSVTHWLDVPETIIKVYIYNPDYDETISDLLYDKRQLQKRNINNSLPLIILADIFLVAAITPSVVIEKQTNLNYTWNDSGQDDGVIWNTQPTAWNSVVTSTDMIPLTVMLDRLRDIVQGEAVTKFDAANTTIELGSGTTGVMITDSALDIPISGTDKEMDSGYPGDGGDAEMEHQSSLSDSDIITFTAQEIGFKVDGILMARVVLGSSFSKSADEIFRIRITSAFSDNDPIKLMIAFLNLMRDLCQGKIVNPLNNANTIMEYGTGTTPVTTSDTDLDNDSLPGTRQGMEAGFPQDDTGIGEAIFENLIEDGDIVTFSATEWGLFENNNLMARLILGSPLNKKTGENVKTRARISFREAI
ncbi:MAG: LamG domain-containing protein [Cocleimonas sp.]